MDCFSQNFIVLQDNKKKIKITKFNFSQMFGAQYSPTGALPGRSQLPPM